MRGPAGIFVVRHAVFEENAGKLRGSRVKTFAAGKEKGPGPGPFSFHVSPAQSGIGSDGVSFRARAAFAAGDEGIDPEGGIAHGNMEG
jgi:hypothetical protein